jgi:hypothetical protein
MIAVLFEIVKLVASVAAQRPAALQRRPGTDRMKQHRPGADKIKQHGPDTDRNKSMTIQHASARLSPT